jgi:hypothetical protein
MTVTKLNSQFYYIMSVNAFTKTNSPLVAVSSTRHNAIWNSSKEIKMSGELQDGLFDEYYDESWNGQLDARIYGGFSENDLRDRFLNFFENDTVMLTIEFVDTNVMQIQRDIRK